ncbi:MAG: hypothetical protein KF760_32195 [Candidatus Eremiobacteraeota bacterium]|nr:hypothetical protein [Candidatus Eremiobacteraeota bacterium]MCW5871397.1 hypothetical protein [Candidatus Eremiobacteraeota bacterium]
MSDELFEQALQVELVKRIDAVSSYTEEDFGRISGMEWMVFLLLGLLIPCVAVWWAA